MKKVITFILVMLFALTTIFVGLTSTETELNAATYPFPILSPVDIMTCSLWCAANTFADPDMYQHAVWDCVNYQCL